jgi:hypothetical protein
MFVPANSGHLYGADGAFTMWIDDLAIDDTQIGCQ